MPRVYKPDPRGRRYKRYPKELIQRSVQEYKNSNESLSCIAKKIELDKSVLYRHSIKKMKTQGGQTVLSEETELEFMKYINICAEWGYPLELYDLRLLVKNYIISGFRKTGINPFDPSEVLKKLPDWQDPSKEAEIVNSTVLNFLKEMRYGSINIVEPKKKKKLQVQAGQSVLCSSDEDYCESDPEYLPCSILRESNEQQKDKQIVINKGKGKGKKTKIKSDPAVLQDHHDQAVANSSYVNTIPIIVNPNAPDEAIPSCSSNINPYDISTMPVIFEDDLGGIGHVETVVSDVENKNPNEKKSKKVEIISNVQVSNVELKKILSIKNVPTISKKRSSRRPSYYKCDDDILKDLMDLE